ncbi:MAG: ribosome small subunit-dependent GTPase A [Lachnospiraceae bacterium]|nr:ribosome small subunit-dependent GTPase A [Lachnospiraceae bacterium]
MKGKIIKGISGFYYVYSFENACIYTCRAKGILRDKKIKPLVGDNCKFDVTDEDKYEGNVTGILTRSNELIRPAVSNVDQMMVIFALSNPKPNFYLLDKFLFFIMHEKLSPILVFNKEDLDADLKEDVKEIYKGIDAPLIFTSAKEKINIDTVKELLKGKTTAVAGPSGVGKSTLINAIVGKDIMETGDISRKTQRGKHTTRHTEMFEFDVDGVDSFILDTPGFSSFYLPTLHEQERASDYYPEFAPFVQKCRFNACLHDREPDCAVKAAVEQGLVSKERYENYLKVLSEIKNNYKY